jgi:hypothetical protein
MVRDYLPQKEVVLYAWVVTFFAYLIANLQRFGIADSVIAPLVSLRNDFQAKYDVAVAPATRTKASVLAKNNAVIALKTALRVFIREYLAYNHLVTDEDRDKLGIPIHKTDRKPVYATLADAENAPESVRDYEVILDSENEEEKKITEIIATNEYWLGYGTTGDLLVDWNDATISIPVKTSYGRGWNTSVSGPAALDTVLTDSIHFYTTNAIPFDWLKTPNSNLWLGDNGEKSPYDPCPFGWRLPVYSDTESVVSP